MEDLAWYVLTVSPLCEAVVAKRIERRFGDSVATYVPVACYRVRKRGHWHDVGLTVFPRYLFAGFSSEPQWLYVRDIVGVQGVFAVDGAPFRVAATLVGDLMSRCARGDFTPAKPPKLQRGMRVVARKGPFRGQQGQIAAVSKADQHAHVLLELFHGRVPARIHLDDLVSVSYSCERMIG